MKEFSKEGWWKMTLGQFKEEPRQSSCRTMSVVSKRQIATSSEVRFVTINFAYEDDFKDATNISEG